MKCDVSLIEGIGIPEIIIFAGIMTLVVFVLTEWLIHKFKK